MTRKARAAECGPSWGGCHSFLDTSVLLASLDPDEPHHVACDNLLAQGGHGVHLHAFAECFSILTGGRMGRRIQADLAARLIEESIAPLVQPLATSAADMVALLASCHERGARGGAVYDLLHLAAARRAGAQVFYTLNLSDFNALARPGDPKVQSP